MDDTFATSDLSGTENMEAVAVKSRVTLEDIERSCLHARRTWTGCCWPTCIGPRRCDANGLTSSQVAVLANATIGEESAAWTEVASWLRSVEYDARLAAEAGLRSIEAARAGQLEEALRYANAASLREQKYAFPNGWKQFRQLVDDLVTAISMSAFPEAKNTLET